MTCLFYIIIGVMVGGRVGYVLFLRFARLPAEPTRHPQDLAGRDVHFHGGFIGVLLATLYITKKKGLGTSGRFQTWSCAGVPIGPGD